MEVTVRKDIHRFGANIPRKSMNSGDPKIANKNFGLTETQFSQMITDLVNKSEKLFEQAFMNHFERSMSYLINKNGAERETAYDVTMNTLLEFRKRLIQGKVKYGNLNFLFTQMCTQRYKRDNESHETFDEETFALLDRTLSKLGEECQALIQDVYYNKLSYKLMEAKYSKASSALRKQKERCITKLKMLIRQKINSN